MLAVESVKWVEHADKGGVYLAAAIALGGVGSGAIVVPVGKA